jgi:hypothetical protein
VILDLISTEKQVVNPDRRFSMRIRTLFAGACTSILLTVPSLQAQVTWEPTRFTISGAPIFAQPRGEFGRNIGNEFGGTGAVQYHIDRAGFLSLRFDVSGVPYGSEERHVPISPTISQRVLLDLNTTNWLTALSLGPELALPKGPIRPYVNAGRSKLLFRTSSALEGESNETFVSTTNFKDSTMAWFFGGGVRIPLAGRDARKAISLDLGLRYYRGGTASYLREGSIYDNPDGSITLNPLTSPTPHIVYLIGVRYRIPHDPTVHCPRLVC